MDKETLYRILNVADAAMTDGEYLRLREEYIPANERFTRLWESLPQEEKDIISDFLITSTALFHRLMALAATAKG